jgi:hypothetical protein
MKLTLSHWTGKRGFDAPIQPGEQAARRQRIADEFCRFGQYTSSCEPMLTSSRISAPISDFSVWKKQSGNRRLPNTRATRQAGRSNDGFSNADQPGLQTSAARFVRFAAATPAFCERDGGKRAQTWA